MFRALKHFLPDRRGHHVLVRTDNTVVVSLSTTREVCFRAPCTSWRTRSLCGPRTDSSRLAKAFLYPRAGYVPKVPSSTLQPVVLQAFCPPPFREPDQQKLNCMCPVRELDTYVHRTALWRREDQLLVCYGPPKRGLAATKQTLSRWMPFALPTSALISPRLWGSRLTRPEVWRPQRPFWQMSLCRTSATLRDGPHP